MSGLGHSEDLKYLGESELLCSTELQELAVPGLRLVGVEDSVTLLNAGDLGHLGDLGVALGGGGRLGGGGGVGISGGGGEEGEKPNLMTKVLGQC